MAVFGENLKRGHSYTFVKVASDEWLIVFDSFVIG